MKLAALAKLINDHGTKPTIKVYKHGASIVYEGNPSNIDPETGKLKVNSFTVTGTGTMDIYTE